MRKNKENQLSIHCDEQDKSKQNYKANFQFHEISQKMKTN